MSVIIETTLGDITVDLYTERRPRCCINFLKLCKLKYYNYNLFHTVSRGFIAQTGDPTGAGNGGQSIWGVLEGENKKYFQSENNPRIKHNGPGLLSFVGDSNGMIGSQFFLTLGDELSYLDAQHCIFGEVVEGVDLLHKLNEVICDEDGRPYKDVRITHTVVLCDPYEDPPGLVEPPCSPPPTAELLQNERIAADEDTDDEANLSATEVAEIRAEREAKARATILEMIGDIPDSEIAPPENVLFVCKLNPVTTDQDLEIIFSRFGKIKSCEVIRDKKTGDSLQYAFIEFEEKSSCENAYFKMDNVLIDDRRIHVDFSQSVAKIRWFGKGRIRYENENSKQDFGKGKYEKNSNSKKSKNNDDKPRKHENVRRNYRNEDRDFNKKRYDNNSYEDRDKNYHKERDFSKKRYDDKTYEDQDRNNQKEREYNRRKYNERPAYNKYDDRYQKNKNYDDRSRYDKYENCDKYNKKYDDRNQRDSYQSEDRRKEYNRRHEPSNSEKFDRRAKYEDKHNRRDRKRTLSPDSEEEYSKSKNKKEKVKKSKKKRDRSSSTSSSSSDVSSSTSSSDSSPKKSKKSSKKKSKKKKKSSKR